MVAISTRSLTVNAAFLKDIKDDNRELKQIFDEMTPLATHPQNATNHWLRWGELCDDLRDQLAMHFSLEEAYGYFDDAVSVAPQLSMKAGVLRSQHRTLFESACALAEFVGGVKTDQIEQVEASLSKFAALRRDFQKHEEAELQIILDAFDNDLGGGD